VFNLPLSVCPNARNGANNMPRLKHNICGALLYVAV